VFNLGGRDLPHGTSLPAALHGGLTDVVPVKFSPLSGMGRGHRGAVGPEQQAL
jgi:hypothetical protein